MKPFIRLLLPVLILLVSGIPVHSAAPAWELDRAHCGIYFSVNHIYSVTRGYFEDFEATIMFAPDDLAGSRFDFKVSVDSINTANSKRDGHLNSGDFFDAKKYPTMTFSSSSIKHIKDEQYMVIGTMTVKDVSQEVSVPFRFMGVKTHPFDKKLEVAGFEAQMTIDRLAYNVGGGKFYDMGVVGKDVDVLISLEVTRKK
jgi:polyisoprenoid-binding protein YceI